MEQATLHLRRRCTSRARLILAALALALLALALVTGCGRYDALVDKDQAAGEKWANLEAQLERRSALVPNLVATVKAAAKHEQDTLTKVTEARSQAAQIHLTADDLTDPAKMAAFQKAQGQLQSALSRLLVVQEAYPDLKANSGFHDLQVQLEGTENRILRAREEYNAAARDYNSELAHVGGRILNKATGKTFLPRVYFTASAEAQAVPTVAF